MTLLISLIVFLLALTAFVLYIIFIANLADTVNYVRPLNRYIKPGQIWRLLIPIYNYYWIFFVVDRVSTSIEAEYKSRDIAISERPTYKEGHRYCIAIICSIVVTISSLIIAHYRPSPYSQVPGWIFSLVVYAFWGMYWIEVRKYGKEIRRFYEIDFMNNNKAAH